MAKEEKIVKLNRVVSIPDFIENNLDEEQLDAVINAKGRALIIAGPGSGKTQTITYKIAYLINSGVNPREILLVTFTRRAARDMISRAQKASSVDLSPMTAGTFHHVCNLLLRRYASLLGFKNSYTILDEEDARALINMARRERISAYKEEGKNVRLPSASVIQKVISYAVNTMSTISDAVTSHFSEYFAVIEDIERIKERYEEKKWNQNALDYDDLLFFTYKLLNENESVRQKIASNYKWVLVDEFQDTNLLQLEIAEFLSSVHKNLIVVGDDGQSIYSFRGARYQNIWDFSSKDDCRVFKLQTNYRSTPQIVSLINHLIPNNVFEKTLRSSRPDGPKPAVVTTWDKQDEALFVANEIVDLMNAGIAGEDIGVLYRSHYHSFDLQLELSRKNVYFTVYSGLRFVETAHIKDMLAFIKLIYNPRDQISWDRCLRLFEGVGKVTSRRVVDRVLNAIESGKDPFEILAKNKSVKKVDIERFSSLIGKIKDETLPSSILDIVYNDFYSDYLLKRYPDHRERAADIERLIDISARYRSIDSFLSDILLSEEVRIDPADKRKQEGVVLTTIHQAKGLEWKVVFILSVNPGDLPSGFAIGEGRLDEEARIFYVAITRARDILYICRQQTGSRSPYYGNKFIMKSEEMDFIKAIPEDMVEWITVE